MEALPEINEVRIAEDKMSKISSHWKQIASGRHIYRKRILQDQSYKYYWPYQSVTRITRTASRAIFLQLRLQRCSLLHRSSVIQKSLLNLLNTRHQRTQ